MLGNGSMCISLTFLGEAFPRSTPSFSSLGFASASSFFSIGLIGAALLGFVLGSALVFPDRVITAFTFSFIGIASYLGKSSLLAYGNADASYAICVSNILLKFHLILYCHSEVAHLTVDTFQDLVIGKEFLANFCIFPQLIPDDIPPR
jgi:hypothetical protein